MIVMNKNSVISISNAVVGMSGTLMQQQFVLSALSSLSPMISEEKALEFEDARQQVINIDYPDVAPENLAKMEDTIWVKAINYYYRRNMDDCRFVFSYAEYVHFWNGEDRDLDGAYKPLTYAAESILKTTMTRRYDSYTASGRVRKDSTSFSLVTEVEIKGTTEVVVQINPAFMPYLVKLTEVFSNLGYTKLPVAMLRCRKSVGELGLMQFIVRKFNNKRGVSQTLSVSLDDFRVECGITAYANNFKDFKRKWLVPAIDAINAHDVEGERVHVDLDFTRKGRRIEGLKFTVTSQDLFNFKGNKKSGNPEIQKKHNVANAKSAIKQPKRVASKPVSTASDDSFTLETLLGASPKNENLDSVLSVFEDVKPKPKPKPVAKTRAEIEAHVRRLSGSSSEAEIQELIETTLDLQK